MRIADVLPLTPLQRGLLFHADVAHSSGDDVYAVQLDVTLSGRLDQHRLREAVQTVVNRVLGNLRPGEIVLMHVGSHPTDGSTLDADALPTIISELKQRGYGFVTIYDSI